MKECIGDVAIGCYLIKELILFLALCEDLLNGLLIAFTVESLGWEEGGDVE